MKGISRRRDYAGDGLSFAMNARSSALTRLTRDRPRKFNAESAV